jgi:hypothetical protein
MQVLIVLLHALVETQADRTVSCIPGVGPALPVEHHHHCFQMPAHLCQMHLRLMSHLRSHPTLLHTWHTEGAVMKEPAALKLEQSECNWRVSTTHSNLLWKVIAVCTGN